MERTPAYFMQFFYLKEAVLIWWRLITCRWAFHYEKRLSSRCYPVSALFQNWSREQILLNFFLFYIEYIHIPHRRMWWKRHWHNSCSRSIQIRLCQFDGVNLTLPLSCIVVCNAKIENTELYFSFSFFY